MQAQMLAPAAVLIAWSLVILVWMGATRLPAMRRAGGGLGTAKPGGRGQDLEGVLDDRVNWKAHNYTHLLEQPTLFYAAIVIIAIMGNSALDVVFAWIYVVLRIAHSLWQATVNRVSLRFALFVLGTLCLAYLAVRAVMLTLFADPTIV